MDNYGQGSVTLKEHAILTWTPDDTFDLSEPSPTVSVIETGDAVAAASSFDWWYFPGLPPLTTTNFAVNDGFSDSPMGNGSHGVYPNTYSVPVLQGGKLSHVLNLPSHTLTASLNSNYDISQLYVSYSVLLDTRHLQITATFPGVYSSTTVLGTSRKSAFTNKDGSLKTDIYGDILYGRYPNTYDGYSASAADIGIKPRDPVTGSADPVDITYTAQVIGDSPLFPYKADTTMVYAWYRNLVGNSGQSDHLGPKGFTLTDSTIDTFFATYADFTSPIMGVSTTTNPNLGTDHVYFTYTPVANGPKYTANYYTSVHPEWTYTLSKKPKDTDWRPAALDVASPGYGGSGGGVDISWNDDDPLEADATFGGLGGTDIVAGAFTVLGASTPNPALNGLLTLAGFTVDKFGPKPASTPWSFDAAWDSPSSTFSSPVLGYDQMTREEQAYARESYTGKPYMFVSYSINYYLGDNYGQGYYNGYIGQYAKALETLDERPDGLGPSGMDQCGAFYLKDDVRQPDVPVHVDIALPIRLPPIQPGGGAQ